MSRLGETKKVQGTYGTEAPAFGDTAHQMTGSVWNKFPGHTASWHRPGEQSFAGRDAGLACGSNHFFSFSPYMPSSVTGDLETITLARFGRGVLCPVLQNAIALGVTPKISAALRSFPSCFRYSVSFMPKNSTRFVDKCNTFCGIIFWGIKTGGLFILLGWENRIWAA